MQSPRVEDVLMRLARTADVPAIFSLWNAWGGENLDRRSYTAVEKAIFEGTIWIFENSQKLIVATGGAYPYRQGRFTELGSSCWIPLYRGLGGADASVCARAVQAAMAHPGTTVGSELYATSVKSRAVLLRCGFELAKQPPLEMQAHACAVGDPRPVDHMVLPPWCFAALAAKLIELQDGVLIGTRDNALRIRFDDQFLFQGQSGRKALDAIAGGDLEVIGYPESRTRNLDDWLANVA